MRHLVDAHSLIWALDDPRKLGIRAIAVLEDPANELLVSVGTIWELSIKGPSGVFMGRASSVRLTHRLPDRTPCPARACAQSSLYTTSTRQDI